MTIQLPRMLFAFLVLVCVEDARSAGKPDFQLNVCMEPLFDIDSTIAAQSIASRLLQDAGVALRWHHRNCPNDAIKVGYTRQFPPDAPSGAVAYALPGAETEILLFHNRLRQNVESHRFPLFLGHVLAHELTHILQGVQRHSEHGLMKARWDWDDHSRMDARSLRLSREDIDMIRRRLTLRAQLQTALPE